MGANRSYGLNATAVQAEKGMITASLEILKGYRLLLMDKRSVSTGGAM